MAKSERRLADRILVAALPRVAHVIKPYPANVNPDELNAAIAALREAKLVHGTAKSPNLTVAGVARAQQLAAKD